MLISALRAPAERGNALLKQTRKALQHTTISPGGITEVTAAALVRRHHNEDPGEKSHCIDGWIDRAHGFVLINTTEDICNQVNRSPAQLPST